MLAITGFLPGDDLRMKATIDATAERPGDERGLVYRYRAAAYANDVGLLAEELDVGGAEMIGNYPQAFSHIGLVNAAWAIAQAGSRQALKSRRRRGPWLHPGADRPAAAGAPGRLQRPRHPARPRRGAALGDPRRRRPDRPGPGHRHRPAGRPGPVPWPCPLALRVPHLARLAGDPATTPATRDAVDVVFQTFNRYLGVAVGEHLGYLFTGLWTALAGVALIQSDVLHPLFGVVGLLLAPLFVVGSLEFVGPFEVRGWKLAGALVPFAYIGWSLWLLALGIALLATA